MHGHLSAQNAIFISDNSLLEYSFIGKDSGYGAVLVCQTDHTCKVNCYDDSCNNLRLFEQGGTLNITCTYAQQSNVCPDGFVLENKIPSLMDVDIIDDDLIGIDICENNETTAINCNGHLSCHAMTHFNKSMVTINNNISNICCSGSRSCQEMGNITLRYNNNSDVVSNIHLDARSAGRLAHNIVSVNGGNIYATGRSSMLNASSVSTTNKNDIFCTARNACMYVMITHANNLYCTGGDSCRYSRIKSIDTVWAYGWSAARDTKMSNINTIYCAARGCQSSSISNVHGTLYGSGYRSLSASTIFNVSNVRMRLCYDNSFKHLFCCFELHIGHLWWRTQLPKQ